MRASRMTPLLRAYLNYKAIVRPNHPNPDQQNRAIRAQCRRVRAEPLYETVLADKAQAAVGLVMPHGELSDFDRDVVLGCLPLFAEGLAHTPNRSWGDACRSIFKDYSGSRDGVEARANKLFQAPDLYIFLISARRFLTLAGEDGFRTDLNYLHRDLRTLFQYADVSVRTRWIASFYYRRPGSGSEKSGDNPK